MSERFVHSIFLSPALRNSLVQLQIFLQKYARLKAGQIILIHLCVTEGKVNIVVEFNCSFAVSGMF